MEVIVYNSTMKKNWDDFIENAVNSHFMHYRDFMDYHSDRFSDHSLVIKDTKGKIIAVLPANLKDGILYSHQGLTFAGLLVNSMINAITVLSIFDAILKYCKLSGIKNLIYKRTPDIFHTRIFQDDLYAIYLNNGNLFRRDLNSCVSLRSDYKYSKGRKWSINKAKKEVLEIAELGCFDEFWMILTDVLKVHDAKPTHSLDEILLLKEKFRENIKLYVSKKENEILAGTVVFINNNVVHTQYMASTHRGREVGALDYLIHELMTYHYKEKEYFNFGISTEESGRYLNEGLFLQKNGFGARSTVNEFYEITIK